MKQFQNWEPFIIVAKLFFPCKDFNFTDECPNLEQFSALTEHLVKKNRGSKTGDLNSEKLDEYIFKTSTWRNTKVKKNDNLPKTIYSPQQII